MPDNNKPSWMSHSEWETLIAGPAREAERRRAEAALIRYAENLNRQSTGASQATRNPQIAAVTEAKECAIEAQDFETAADLREIEKRLMRGK